MKDMDLGNNTKSPRPDSYLTILEKRGSYAILLEQLMEFCFPKSINPNFYLSDISWDDSYKSVSLLARNRHTCWEWSLNDY